MQHTSFSGTEPVAIKAVPIKVCAIIPAYRVKNQVLSVINSIGAEVTRIYVIDDCCPEKSGKLVEDQCSDPRVVVLYNKENLGVGGAVIRGYRAGLEEGMDILVKIDGDGQMNPSLINKFLRPILLGETDYTKGTRFFSFDSLRTMPTSRKIGNTLLSFVNKFTSGYWNIMDPTNGYTAIHRFALSHLPLEKINQRYFFESDMLFRLGTIRAVVKDIPIDSVYAGQNSSLQIGKTAIEFIPLYIRAFIKRVLYLYLLRDFNVATLEMIVGSGLLLFGLVFGGSSWSEASSNNQFASTGTVMIAVVPIIIGFQLLLSAMHFDISNVPKIPLQSLE